MKAKFVLLLIFLSIGSVFLKGYQNKLTNNSIMNQDIPEPIIENKENKEEETTEDKNLPKFTEEINLGKTYFPRNFIHQQKNYNKGNYWVKLGFYTENDKYYFQVYDQDNQLLFEELALMIPRKIKGGKFNYRIKKRILGGQEYFMIKIIKPDKYLYSFFYIKKTPPPTATKET